MMTMLQVGMQEGVPITAVSFSPDSKLLALGTASNKLVLFHVDTRQPFELSEELRQAVRSRLARLPGSLTGISFIPGSKVRLQLSKDPLPVFLLLPSHCLLSGWYR